MKKFFVSIYRLLFALGALCGIILANSIYAHGVTPFGIGYVSGPFEGAKKKVAGQIQYGRYGRTIIRGYPKEFHKPTTQDFVLRTERFTYALNLCRQLRPYAKMLILPRQGYKSAFNSLMGFFTKAFDYSGGLDALWAPKMMQCAKGLLPAVPHLSLTAITGYKITATWSTVTTSPDETATDKAYFLLTDEDGTFAILIASGASRSAGTFDIVVPSYMTSMKIFVSTVIFMSSDGKMVSDGYFSQSDTPVTLVA